MMRIDPDFSEDTVSIAVATYLAVLSFPQFRFSIEPFSRSDERWLGADVRLTDTISAILPFYMQFKRPAAYKDGSRSKIIKDRRSLKPPLSTSPATLYFGLREKQPEHWDYQHNILYRLRRRLLAKNLGDAAYVCPLFMTRHAYMHHAHMSALGRLSRHGIWYPYDLEDILIADGGKRMSFARVPFLEEHITIPPHDKVHSAKHSYSFLENGTEICFHSPLALESPTKRLSGWLSNLGTSFLTGEGLVRRDNAPEALQDLVESGDDGNLGFQPDQSVAGRTSSFGSWLAWGDYLSHTYSIEQFAFVLREP